MWYRILSVIVFEFQKLIEVRFAPLWRAIRRLRYGYTFRKIPLSKQKFAIVDPEDYFRLMQFRWHARASRHTFYAVHSLTNGRKEKRKNAHMHRLVIDIPDGCVCDHINHNGLDNRKANLRPATATQNSCNRKGVSRTSRFKGVSWNKLNQRWRAAMGREGKNVHLGYYDDEVEAAKAYDKAARQLHGEFAVLNFPPPKTSRWRPPKFNKSNCFAENTLCHFDRSAVSIYRDGTKWRNLFKIDLRSGLFALLRVSTPFRSARNNNLSFFLKSKIKRTVRLWMNLRTLLVRFKFAKLGLLILRGIIIIC